MKLVSWLEELNIKIEINTKKIITPLELDIFLPEYNLAIEINGVYWHQDDARLLEKTEKCENIKIELLHFWDYEILFSYEKVKSIILHKLKKSKNKIFARKTKIIKISSKKAREFLELNHLDGFGGAKYHYGLFDYDNNLIQVASIGKCRFNKHCEFELIRFASKLNTTIPGGFSKMIKFIKEELKIYELLSYANRRYSTGNTYTKIGRLINIAGPNYFWVKGDLIYSRYQTQKHKLSKLKLKNYDPLLSEAKNMENNGFFKIKDCGNLTFIL
jgi:very-short-patch-repair endonuclease